MSSQEPIEIPNFRVVTISGRIAAGSTSLARHISKALNWRHVEGGEVFWEAVRRRLSLEPKDTKLRPDEEDEAFDSSLKKILKEEKHIVLETKLAGYNARGIDGVFKILVICANEDGKDQTQIRIDRLVNREKRSMADAKEEVLVREKSDLEKWRRLYANNEKSWYYWDSQYYDLVINTYFSDQEKSLKLVLNAIGFAGQTVV
jgi:cytidylate kinase